ncbi:MAG TPA: hypothetical protein VGE09_05605 [Pseudoxanthomonas sp.]
MALMLHGAMTSLQALQSGWRKKRQPHYFFQYQWLVRETELKHGAVQGARLDS